MANLRLFRVILFVLPAAFGLGRIIAGEKKSFLITFLLEPATGLAEMKLSHSTTASNTSGLSSIISRVGGIVSSTK